MKCPFCGEKMKKGYIQGKDRIAWVKKKHIDNLTPGAEEILLENNNACGFLYQGRICRSCKKIIFNYSIDRDFKDDEDMGEQSETQSEIQLEIQPEEQAETQLEI